MRITYRIAAVLTALALVLGLCACGPKREGSGYYLYYALDLDGSYVYTEYMEGRSLTLNDNGSGQLDWGDGDIREITGWSIDGESVVINTADQTISGTLRDGILTADITDDDNSWKVVFFSDKADTTGMVRISAVDYQDMIAAGQDENTGMYDCFGVENSDYPGYVIDMGEGYSYIELKDDGRGYYYAAGAESELEAWSIDGNAFSMTVNGEAITGKYDNGVISLYSESSGETTYYAPSGADLSGYFILSREDMDAIINAYY